MRALVTGGAGFLGRECLRQLRAEGIDTVSTDRAGEVDLRGDLSDPEFCATLPDVDAVVHNAGVQYLSPDLPLFSRPAYFERNNVRATGNLARRYSGTKAHFTYVGTSMMYRVGEAISSSKTPMLGQGVYSASKLAAWEKARALPNPTALMVPCIIAGPGRGGLFGPFARSIARFGAVVFPGEGSRPTHMVHVEDAAGLLVRIVARGAAGVFNAAGPEPLSIVQWADAIAEELGVKRVRRLRLPLAPVEWISAASGYRLLAAEQLLLLRHGQVLDVKESLALGWRPRWTNAQIVRATARALLASA
ncbi:MAG TPA: NAD(P)-dependent oxidoreductase [Burkholderiales bacterium]|nr:NAD(P)-dependent oxidoreductase [Burkholderiales bacterium]